MQQSEDEDLTSYFDQLSPPIVEMVLAVREVVQQAAPQALESIVWGGLSYHRQQIGGRVKGAVCQIVVKGDLVRLDFIHGVRLPDPHRLLQGDLVSKRFVPMSTIADVRRPEIADLIRQAASLVIE